MSDEVEKEVEKEKPSTRKSSKKQRQPPETTTTETPLNRELDSIQGVGPAMVTALEKVGIKSLFSLALQDPRKLADVKGISVEGARKLVIAAKKAMGKRETITAKELLIQVQQDTDIVSTGSESFDTILGGGVRTSESYHFFGEYRTGKTEACLQIAVNAVRPPEYGGFGESTLVYWIATERFPVRRVIEMVKAYECWQGQAETIEIKSGKKGKMDLPPIMVSEQQLKVLENFIVKQCSSTAEQTKAGKDLYTFIDEQPTVRIVIVDSLMALFRAEFVGRGELHPRQQAINQHLHDLKEAATLANAALIFTNQVMESPDLAYGDPKKPTGGHIVKHNIENVVKFRKARDNLRVVQLIDAQDLPEQEGQFKITPEGVRD